MKKLLLGILFIIPLVIVSVVILVTVVVSTFHYIGVESVTLDKTVVELAFGKEYYDISDYLSVEVMPKRATNSDCTWSIESLTCWDDDYLSAWENYKNGASTEEVLPPATLVDGSGSPVDSNSDGKIMINSYCSFVLVAQAETMSARCNVIVSGAELEEITVTEAKTLTVGESQRLDYKVDPVDAIIKGIEWVSLDKNVVTVDKNGVIKAKGVGQTEVVVKAQTTEGKIVEGKVEVNVEKGISAFGNKVYLCKDSISLDALGVLTSDVISTTNCTVSGSTLALHGNEAQLTLTSGILTLIKCDEDEFVIDGSQFFNSQSDYILTAGHTLNLSAKGLCDICTFDSVGISWSVDNDSVATITEDGVLTGVGDGLVTVTAERDGRNAIITINVQKKVTTLVVDRTAKELSEIGLAKEYVMGASRYEVVDDTYVKVPNWFEIDVVKPAVPESPEEKEAFYKMFDFTVNESGVSTNKAYFEGNKLIFVPENITGKTELTVVVKAKNPMYASLDYLTTAEVSIKVTDAVAVSNYGEIKHALDHLENVCLVNNIKYFDGDPTPTACQLNAAGDYYGNGYMLSAAHNQIMKWQAMIIFVGSDVVISNGIFRCNEFPGDTITSEGENKLVGSPFVVSPPGSIYDESQRRQNVLVEYCISENGENALLFYGSDVTVRGCILRNTSGAGIVARTERTDEGICYTNLTIENCVLSNMLGLGFSFQYVRYDKDGEDATLQAMAEGRNSHLYQKGFLDIYNWQPANTMGLLPAGTLGDGMESLEAGINAMLRDEFTKDALAPYRYTYDNIDYFLLGGMSVGLMHKSYLEGSIADPRLIFFDSTIIDNVLVSSFTPAYIFTYKNDVTDITPGRTYVVNRKLIEKLHGVGVEYNEGQPFSFA